MHASTPGNAPPEFDAYSQSYNEQINKVLKFSGLKIDFFARVKNDYLIDIINLRPGGAAAASILDIGCGVGNAHRQLVDCVAKLAGVDVSPASIAVAQQCNPNIEYECFDGLHLPYANSTFDVAFAVNVFHHVPVPNRHALILEIRRVLRSGGLFVVFEHNPLNPVTLHVVNNCAMDNDAVLLNRHDAEELLRTAEFQDIQTRFILAIPAAGSFLRKIDRWFSLIPLGAQYYTLGSVR
jgi:SAM-dependent methyltransferase